MSAFEQKKPQTLDVLGCMYRYTSHHACASRRQGSDDKGTYYLGTYAFFFGFGSAFVPFSMDQHRTINSRHKDRLYNNTDAD